MKTTITSLLAIAAALALTSGDASAKPKHRAAPLVAQPTYDAAASDPGQIPLTVNRRSWLDPGPVAPRGTGNAYVTANTGEFIQTPITTQDPDMYGRDVMQGQPYVPGRTQPVVEFSTTPNGHVDVANELLPQNFYYNPQPSLPPTNYRQSYSSPVPNNPLTDGQ